MNPELKQDIIDFLFALRESGLINMMEAGASIMAEFKVDRKTAKAHLLDWMANCDKYEKANV